MLNSNLFKALPMTLIVLGVCFAGAVIFATPQHTVSLVFVPIAASLLLILAGFALWVMNAKMRRLSVQSKELLASQECVRELGHFRQQFLANMSHEFRTPLNAIQGFAQAILYQQDDMTREQVGDYVRIIEKSARDLGDLTDNALDLSKLDAQKFPIRLSDIDFSRAVCDAVGRHSAEAAERDIILHCDIEEDWIVRADQAAVKRCISSILTNAIKFSYDKKKITIRVSRWGRRSFVIEVKDQGCGIPGDEIENIWTAYTRSAWTKKTGRIGAGLGLAITRALMNAHNGYIEIESGEDVGTTARLCFPNTMIVGLMPDQVQQTLRRAANG